MIAKKNPPTSNSDALEQRKKLSFEQAEGVAPMPSQLARGAISQEFRAVLWFVLAGELERHRVHSGSDGPLHDPWLTILQEAHAYRHHRLDDFPYSYRSVVEDVKKIIEHGAWSEVLGWLEWVLKHPSCPENLPAIVNAHMTHCHLAYRVFDGSVICPIGTEAERDTIERAFSDLAMAEFHGARAHLRKAAEELSAGRYADSVRESIHAVEATARVLEPSAALSSALARLEQTAKIHTALKIGFGKLYGYTSDEEGIRHPLLDDGTANVDETDALFMIGACAAFVSYLINKARSAGILSERP
jgi:hypothetical protein